MTTLPERPSFDQFNHALETLRGNNFADISSENVQLALQYGAKYGWYFKSFVAVLAGQATAQQQGDVLHMLHHYIARARVEAAGGTNEVLVELQRFMRDLESSRRYFATDVPYRDYYVERLAEALKLDKTATISDIIAAICHPEAAALMESRAANDYWRLRLLLAATLENRYYFREFPVTIREARMSLYTVRRTLEAPRKAQCSVDKDQTPSVTRSVATGAFLFTSADDETTVPNPLLQDDAQRNWYEYDPHSNDEYHSPGVGPYKTRPEADAFGDAWVSYADTIGGQSITVEVSKYTPPATKTA